MMDALDFHVRIFGDRYGEYTAEVLSSPVGETVTGTPLVDPLQITALRSKHAAHPTEASLKKFGTLLFNSLFSGEMLDKLRTAITSAIVTERTLRIGLMIEPNELSALPWELLFDPNTEQFLAMSDHTTLFRYIPLRQAPQALLASELPIKILTIFPNPADLPPVDIAFERQVMDKALAPLISSGLVELIFLEPPTVRKMVETIRDSNVHILYYQGHVGFDPDTKATYFLMEDRHRDSFRKGMMELSYTLRINAVRLAVINSRGMSAGALAYELVRHGVPAAVATQEPLGDEETSTFLAEFSQALARGTPLDIAVAEGRRAMADRSKMNGRWASPILVLRQPEAALFALKGVRS